MNIYQSLCGKQYGAHITWLDMKMEMTKIVLLRILEGVVHVISY